MKKSLAFILALTLVLGSFGFSFGTVANTPEVGDQIQGVELGFDGSGTENPGTDGSGTENPGTDGSGTSDPGTDGSGTENPGTDGSGTNDLGTGSEGDVNTLRTLPAQNIEGGDAQAQSLVNFVSYKIVKEVVIAPGSVDPEEKEFTFNIEVHWDIFGLGVFTWKEDIVKTIKISEGTTSGSVTMKIWKPIFSSLKLVITEVKGPDGDGWIYDENEYTVQINNCSQGKSTTFVNTFNGVTPPDLECDISLTKQVATSIDGPWSDDVTVTNKNATVYYRFIVTNTGDYNFATVKVSDSAIGPMTSLGPLGIGATVTSGAIEYVLTAGSNWVGDTFTNTAEVTGCNNGEQVGVTCDPPVEPENICCTKTDTAVVTYNAGTPIVSECGISLVKQVATTSEGAWGENVEVTSKTGTVYYRFIVENTGDYNFNSVLVSDPLITASSIQLGALVTGNTVTSEAIEYDLTNVTSWNDNIFTNTAEVKGCTNPVNGSQISTCCPPVNKCCTDSAIATVTYKPDDIPGDLQIPICKEVTANSPFGTQTFNFDIRVQTVQFVEDDGEPNLDQSNRVQLQSAVENWPILTSVSITVSDSDLSNCEPLILSNEMLQDYADGNGNVWLRISEINGGASYWTYDSREYYVHVLLTCGVARAMVAKPNCDPVLLGIYGSLEDDNGVEEILFENSYNYTSGGGGRTSRTTTDTEIVVVEDPIPLAVEETIIPAAAMPTTGGLGFGIFMLVGGVMTAFGVKLRKEDEE